MFWYWLTNTWVVRLEVTLVVSTMCSSRINGELGGGNQLTEVHLENGC